MQYKTQKTVFLTKKVCLSGGESFPVLTFADWEHFPGVRHCFTTRAGGVSEGFLSSLNFRRDSPDFADSEENLLENYRRAAAFFDVTPDRIVCARQTHTANVRIVTEADAGKGVTRDRDYTDVDGLITNVPGLVLFTSHADCPPLYFYDPVRGVIALSHSGWKGTVARIGEVTVRKMQREYGCRPEDIHAAIGPSICQDCYEVSEDVAEEMRRCFGEQKPYLEAAGDLTEHSMARPAQMTDFDPSGGVRTETIPHILARGKKPGKYQLSLWEANRRILMEAGILPDHLTVTNLCTCENSRELFSHRATGGRRGNLGAFLMLEHPGE